jgi:putative ABC transport system permease protein
MRRRTRTAPSSTLPVRALLSESVAGLLQRPARTVLTALGTVLGIGALVAILGLTATATGQISKRFTILVATEVTVEPADPGVVPGAVLNPFPSDADQRVRALNGVNQAGVSWQLPRNVAQTVHGASVPGRQLDTPLAVQAASPGYLAALRPTIAQGRLYDAFHEERAEHVAVLGSAAAKLLGVSTLEMRPAVIIDGTPFAVVGIIADVARGASALSSVLIPRHTAETMWPVREAPMELRMLIDTKLGAAPLVARQVALALRPDQPDLFKVIPPPDPHGLRDAVGGDLKALFLLLAVVCLVIGAVGIANTTLVAVLERTGEIGLRRALGARPRHVAAQFLTEAATTGTLGGMVGAALGVVATLAVAASQEWTPLVDPNLVLVAPLLGTLTGLVAGLYPALRAARVEPARALQR